MKKDKERDSEKKIWMAIGIAGVAFGIFAIWRNSKD
jgi:hypothetical protein